MDMILDLRNAPADPVERVVWLGGVMDAVRRELDEAYTEAYFEARLQGRFEAALQHGPHPRKRALAYTRRANNARNRMVRWGDGLDPKSSAFRGD